MKEKRQFRILVQTRFSYRHWFRKDRRPVAWRVWHVYCPWWGYHRGLRTTQERRVNVGHAVEFREEGIRVKFRNRLRYPELPNAWDDLNRSNKWKSWKDRTRCRKQWETNLEPRRLTVESV